MDSFFDEDFKEKRGMYTHKATKSKQKIALKCKV